MLAGALDFYKVAGFLHHHVEVHLGAGIFLIGQIQTDFAVDDAHGHRGDGIEQRLAGDDAFGLEVGDGIGKRNVGARDGGGAGAAIGLQHVAVELDGVFAQLLQVHGGAQGAAD